MKNIFDVSLDYLLCLDDYSSHNKELTQKVNWFVQHELRKEILNYENQSNKQSI